MVWDKPPRKELGPGSRQELEEIFRHLKSRYAFSRLPRGLIWWAGGALLVLIVVLSSYYTVEPQETAVVQRFGRFVRTAGAGLHFKMPFGIEQVRKVVTGRVLQREYGYRTIEPGIRSRFAEKAYEEESRMLSGDLNVVDLQWTVQYKVQNPTDYLFRVKDVEGTLDDISESVMRRIVGNRYVDEVLTVGRASVAAMAQREMQEILDQYQTGLHIVMVKLQNANPPGPVKAAFNEVNEAQQEKERMINEAQQAYNEKIPRAKGEARQRITQAQGYALERVNRARGDVARFADILAEYQKAPAVTRSRMYLESFSEFAKHAKRFIVLDGSQKSILPLFDLNQWSAGAAVRQSMKPAGPVQSENLMPEVGQ